jgi:hypothetical protein
VVCGVAWLPSPKSTQQLVYHSGLEAPHVGTHCLAHSQPFVGPVLVGNVAPLVRPLCSAHLPSGAGWPEVPRASYRYTCLEVPSLRIVAFNGCSELQ